MSSSPDEPQYARPEFHRTSGPSLRRVRTWIVGLILVLLAGYALRLLYPVVMPLAAALVFVVLVWPLEEWTRRRLPEKLSWVALIPPMLVYVLIIAAVVGAIWLTADLTAGRSDQIRSSLQNAVDQARSWAQGTPLESLMNGGSAQGAASGTSATTQPSSGADSLLSSDRLRSYATSFLGTFWEVVGMVVLIFFLALLMLIEARRWPEKLRRALGDHRGDATAAAMGDVAHKVRQYILIRTYLSALSAVCAGIWLFVIGVPLAPVWAIVIFVLNYIPNIGSIIAVFPPTLMAIVSQGLTRGLIALAGLTVIEQIIGNFIDPRWQGHRLRLSPVLVLTSVIFWSWAWGIAGAFLGVPITAALVVAANHVPQLQPLAILASKDARGQDK